VIARPGCAALHLGSISIYAFFGGPGFNGGVGLEIAVPHPVVIAATGEAELVPVPIPSDWIIEGTPQVRSRRLATAPDGAAAVIVWACSAGRFHWHYPVDEFLHVMSGEVFVTDEKGDVRRLGPGDMAFFPAGGQSIWHVPHEVKKLAICHQHMPALFGFALRAWNKFVAVLYGPAEQGGRLDGEAAGSAEPQRAAAV
jgi:uncharacterized cupin superfamily protein